MAEDGKIELDGEVKTGVRRVIEGAPFKNLLKWLPRAGEAITISGLNGSLFRARVLSIDKNRAEVLVFESCGRPEKAPEITLLQALPERQRMELIIEKTAELGVARICPFKSERSISLAGLEKAQKRSHNWGLLALKAAKQCRRDTIPEVLPYASFKKALDLANGCDLKILLSERKDITHIKDALSGSRTDKVAVLTGPEGGFTDEEIQTATALGFIEASLGPRVLRAETAPILAIGLVMYELSRTFP